MAVAVGVAAEGLVVFVFGPFELVLVAASANAPVAAAETVAVVGAAASGAVEFAVVKG